MKQTVRRIGIGLLCLLVLIGCVQTSDPITIVSSPRPVSPEPTRKAADSVSAEPSETPEPFIELLTPSPEPFDLSPYRVSDEGVYDILPLVSEPNKWLVHAGFAGDNTLLLLFYDETAGMLYWQHFDLLTCERVTLRVEAIEYAVEYPEQYYFFSSNPPLYRDTADDALVCLSADLQTEWRIPDIGAAECFWDGENVLRYDYGTRTISRICPDGTETKLFAAGWRYRYANLLSVSADRRYAALSATDAYRDEFVTILVDLSTGEVVGTRAGDTHISFSAGRYASLTREYRWDDEQYLSESTITIGCADTPDEATSRLVQRVYRDFYPSLYDVPGGFAAEVWDEDVSLYYWDDSGETERSAALPLERYRRIVRDYRAESNAAKTEEPDEYGEEGDVPDLYPSIGLDAADSRYLLCDVRFCQDSVALLLWDRTAGSVTHTTGMTYAEPLFAPEQEVDTSPARYADRVAAIERQYGIAVLIGDAAQLSIASYTTDVASIEESLYDIDKTMDVLEKVLAAYPPDFFRLLLGETGDSLVVELCGRIRSTDAYALDCPSAVTYHTDGTRIIVLDVSYYYEMEYTLHHEISHLIDHRLDAITMEPAYWNDENRDRSVWSYAGWESLNPSGFSYYCAYVDDNGNSYEYSGSVKYTPLHSNYTKKNKRSSVYFCNTYSKTYPTEDRAVMFGQLLTNTDNDEILSCPHVLKKLQYYSAAIRALLDPDGTHWPGPTAWELRIDALKAMQ